MEARAATAADYDRFVRFFAELATGDPVPGLTRWEGDLAPGAIFLEEAGATVGYGLCRVLGDTGFVMHVVVDPAARGRGVGRAVMLELAARLRAAGCSRWCLNVKQGNAPAIALYEGLGLRTAYASTALSLDWDRVGALPHEAGPFEVRPIEPADDRALEAAFDLPAGRVAELRARHLVLRRLVERDRPDEARVGVACFDVEFQGAYPFRVARPALASCLLEGLRPYARPGHGAIRLLIEDDAALTDVLRAAGAEVKLEMLHLCGEIPAG